MQTRVILLFKMGNIDDINIKALILKEGAFPPSVEKMDVTIKEPPVLPTKHFFVWFSNFDELSMCYKAT